MFEHVAELDAHINASDKVYRNAVTERYVKVRAVRIAAPPGAGFGSVVIEFSGAICGEDGKALRHGDGFQVAPAQRHTIHSDQPADFAGILEATRLVIAAAAERAAETEAAFADLPR